MIRATKWAFVGALLLAGMSFCSDANAQNAYSQNWGNNYSTQDWGRFRHYPYVYYPQNFYGPDYYRSTNSLYYRYPAEMRIPVYNRQWFNYYPEERLYHSGHHFLLDTF